MVGKRTVVKQRGKFENSFATSSKLSSKEGRESISSTLLSKLSVFLPPGGLFHTGDGPCSFRQSIGEDTGVALHGKRFCSSSSEAAASVRDFRGKHHGVIPNLGEEAADPVCFFLGKGSTAIAALAPPLCSSSFAETVPLSTGVFT